MNEEKELKNKFGEALSERIGLSEAQNRESLKNSFRSSSKEKEKVYQKWRKMIDLIFPKLAKYYGKKIPCGQFHPKLYGIVRFVSSWNPPGGRKQENIMLSNVLQTIGKEVPIQGREGINFYLLPTYKEVISKTLKKFDKFQKMKKAVMEYGNAHLTWEYETKNHKLYLLDQSKGSPNNHERWKILIEEMTEDTENLLTQLKEDFNRNYLRPFIFITFFYNLFKGVDFSTFTQSEYIQIYEDPPRGFYPKVLAITLQQAFQKYEVIPIDTWIKTFFEQPFQIPENWSIPESGKNLGKFERFLWYSGQLRKNNLPIFNDILHCTKTGVLHSKTMRMRNPNPLSCSLCSIQDECPAYDFISRKRMFVVPRDKLKKKNKKPTSPILLKRPKLKIEKKQKRYFDSSPLTRKKLTNTDFVVTTDEKQHPEEVYLPKRKDRTAWKLHDDMSSFQITGTLSSGFHQIQETEDKL